MGERHAGRPMTDATLILAIPAVALLLGVGALIWWE